MKLELSDNQKQKIVQLYQKYQSWEDKEENLKIHLEHSTQIKGFLSESIIDSLDEKRLLGE